MARAGRLKHRIKIQRQSESQNPETGAIIVTWVDVGTVWAEIAPISAREFTASDTEFSKVTTRITIRYRSDVDAKMRVIHTVDGVERLYNIEGVLYDKESGLEHITLPCSVGVRYQEDVITGLVPVNVTLPIITGDPSVGETLRSSFGVWTNDPTSFTYQWFVNDAPILSASGTVSSSFVIQEDSGRILVEDSSGYVISEATNPFTLIVPDKIGSEIKIGVMVTNAQGNSEIAYSLPVTITA